MSDMQKKLIRDFIYVDQGKLYSLYSQLNKGVAQQVFESFVHGEAATKSQPNPEYSDELIESQRSKTLHRTENTVLYDYMYERLEQQLQHVITDAAEIMRGKDADELTIDDVSEYNSKLENAFLIKAAGNVEIEDYQHLDKFLERSNDLMTSIAILETHSDENRARIRELENLIGAEKDRNRKAALREQLKGLQNAVLRAQALGLLTDEELIQALILILETFYGEGLEISITLPSIPYTTFRGVIDREWLRFRPELLRSLYGGVVKSRWTMVGQITSLLRYDIENIDFLNIGLTAEDLAKAKSIREPIRALFNRIRAMEEMLSHSALRREVVVYPLAIYREMEIAIPDAK